MEGHYLLRSHIAFRTNAFTPMESDAEVDDVFIADAHVHVHVDANVNVNIDVD